MAKMERCMSEKRDELRPYHLKGVIDIGSTSIRMVVAQINEDESFQILESLNQSVSIGSDTFTHGQIARSTIEECVKVLRNFSVILAEYHIDLRTAVRAVATSAVREAGNRDEFLDRVYIATQINVEVIEGAEVNRLRYLAIQPLLEQVESLRRNRLVVVEVGGGSTEMIGLEDGRVCYAHTYRMGSYRSREMMDALETTESRKHELLRAEVDSNVRRCKEGIAELRSEGSMLLMGGDARFAATQLLKEWDFSGIAEIKVTELTKLANSIMKLAVDQVVTQYMLAFEEALALGPALEIYARLAKGFGLKKVLVCGLSLRDGLIFEAAHGNVWTDVFVEQILHSAREVGRHYQLDQKHADAVSKYANAIFHALQREHQLGHRYEIILKVAAQLHDIGTFIGSSSHHKHSRYIIEQSDIFGLGDEERKIAAIVARYHRRAVPRSRHVDYAAYPREKRLIICKLSAILRVADSLDRSHNQGLGEVRIEVQKNQLIIQPGQSGEFTAEKRALAAKGSMLEQIYGLTPVLRTQRR
jgi:exopolyphosphatase / guanosine-5'-triphosphate,3'-diphosphate pyrophosphatase